MSKHTPGITPPHLHESVFIPLNDENQNILFIPSELKAWSLENETCVLFYRKKNLISFPKYIF